MADMTGGGLGMSVLHGRDSAVFRHYGSEDNAFYFGKTSSNVIPREDLVPVFNIDLHDDPLPNHLLVGCIALYRASFQNHQNDFLPLLENVMPLCNLLALRIGRMNCRLAPDTESQGGKLLVGKTFCIVKMTRTTALVIVILKTDPMQRGVRGESRKNSVFAVCHWNSCVFWTWRGKATMQMYSSFQMIPRSNYVSAYWVRQHNQLIKAAQIFFSVANEIMCTFGVAISDYYHTILILPADV